MSLKLIYKKNSIMDKVLLTLYNFYLIVKSIVIKITISVSTVFVFLFYLPIAIKINTNSKTKFKMFLFYSEHDSISKQK